EGSSRASCGTRCGTARPPRCRSGPRVRPPRPVWPVAANTESHSVPGRPKQGAEVRTANRFVMRRLISSVAAVVVAAGSGVAMAAGPDPVGLGQKLGQGVVNQAGADC